MHVGIHTPKLRHGGIEERGTEGVDSVGRVLTWHAEEDVIIRDWVATGVRESSSQGLIQGLPVDSITSEVSLVGPIVVVGGLPVEFAREDFAFETADDVVGVALRIEEAVAAIDKAGAHAWRASATSSQVNSEWVERVRCRDKNARPAQAGHRGRSQFASRQIIGIKKLAEKLQIFVEEI